MQKVSRIPTIDCKSGFDSPPGVEVRLPRVVEVQVEVTMISGAAGRGLHAARVVPGQRAGAAAAAAAARRQDPRQRAQGVARAQECTSFLLLRTAVTRISVNREGYKIKTFFLYFNVIYCLYFLQSDPAKRDNVPKCLNSGQLVRELCKELRTLEKRSASAANKDKVKFTFNFY